MDELKQYVYIGGGFLSIGAYLYTWLTSRSKANSSSIDRINDRLGEHDTRLTKVESTIAAVPELRGDLSKVFDRVNEVSETTHNIDGQLTQMNRSMSIMLEHLMKDKT